MRRAPALVLVAAVALAAGCATSPCQELGEKLCKCQPGMTEDGCKTQVQDQLNQIGVGTPGFGPLLDHIEAGESAVTFEDYCQERLAACNAPEGVDFCEWLLTAPGKDACGVTPANPAP
ncbi:MAG TPA: hypothetical protein VFL83_02285 [Anaeromyxobacter sp.]|nr:hypothetical protein [Anaeromyxobacter sp.]